MVALLFGSFIAKAQQVPKSLTASNGVFIGFYEYKPVDYSSNPNTQYPLIIFLHGIGERGDGVTNLPLVLSNGIPQKINLGHNMRFFWNGKWETFLVLSPQLSTSYGDWPTFYVDEMIKYAKNNLRVDPNRIYLTGLSLGGGGVWRYASASASNASQLAAIAPVCGTCAVSNACNIANANLPVWAFHAANDGVVGAGCTTSAIQAINNCNPATKPLMHIYPTGGHAIWYMSYDTDYGYHDINLYEWFLGQNKSLPANILPVARAGNDVTINSVIGTVELNGAGSTDADGNIVRYAWRKIGGFAAGTITNAISTNGIASVSGLINAGTYQFELRVVDNRGGTSLDTITVTASVLGGGNVAPVANAGPDQSISSPSTMLNGSGSYDSDGGITSWSWAKTSGPAEYYISNTSISNPTVSNLVTGTYEFTLTVRDQHGASSSDVVKITVNGGSATPPPPPPPSNYPPIAAASANFALTLPTNSATINGFNSYDPDGQITAFNWTKIGGPVQGSITNANASQTTITGLVQGVYLFKLTVTDNAGATGADTLTVTVNPGASTGPGSQRPIARAGSDVVVTLPTNSATLNGYGSYDPDGTITSFNWSKVNGPAQGSISDASNGGTSITNLAQGVYYIRLLVTDNAGLTADDTVMITVNGSGTVPPPPAPNPNAPIARAGADITLVLPVNNTMLKAYDSYDPDGVISSYNWAKVAGPSQYSLSDPSGGMTSVSNLTAGTYSFRLLVTDNSGLTDDDTVVIVVSGTATPPPPPPPGGNIAPIAKAGADLNLPATATSASLKGYDSYDPDGIITSFTWTKIGGPSQGVIANASEGATTVSGLAQGTYSFQLLVKDNGGLSAADTVIVNIGSTYQTNTNGQQAASENNVLNVVEEKIQAYPNPATSVINIQAKTDVNGQARVNIYDASGKIVSSHQFYKAQPTYILSLTVSQLKQGIYYAEMVIDGRKKLITKFVKQ